MGELFIPFIVMFLILLSSYEGTKKLTGNFLLLDVAWLFLNENLNILCSTNFNSSLIFL